MPERASGRLLVDSADESLRMGGTTLVSAACPSFAFGAGVDIRRELAEQVRGRDNAQVVGILRGAMDALIAGEQAVRS